MGTTSKKKSTKSGAEELDRLVAGLRVAIGEFSTKTAGVTPSKLRSLRKRFEAAAQSLSAAALSLDTTKRPSSVFDPSNPSVVGRFIALTMIAQDRVPLGTIGRFYGAGVYGIYYNGAFSGYAPISRSEHPIYVGKADPPKDAKTAEEQGTKLFARLNEHKKGIQKAANLDINDFECRYLVVASGWQRAAEDYLIQLFKPIWNNEVRLVFGIGKHGDAATTRGNRRSPWDTLHPGRRWAGSAGILDQKPEVQILRELNEHFTKQTPYRNIEDIFSRFMKEMHQLAPVTR